MKITSFEELNIWKRSVDIAKAIYVCTQENDFRKDFGLCDQIRRSIVSVSSNIVEGFERNNTKEFIRFLKIAKGSLGEARSQIMLAKEIGYLKRETEQWINEDMKSLSRSIGSLIHHLRTFPTTLKH